MSYTIKEASPKRHGESRNIENVLVMQGGGSLGAFACGVFKALVKHKVQIDIVTGTSIGAVNAAIIAGTKSGHPEKDLEDFWMEIGGSSLGIIPDLWVYGWDSRARKYMLRPYHQPLQMQHSSEFLKCLFQDGNGGIPLKTFKVSWVD